MVTACDKATACNTDLTVSYFFDTDEGRSNFITEIPELLCYSDAQIGLQGTSYFAGYMVGSLVWMRLTDFWGRKWMIMGGLILLVLTLSVYLVKITVSTLYATIFLFGLEAPLIESLPYLLLMESVSPKSRAFASAALSLFGSLTFAYLPLIYQFGKDWWIVYWLDMGLAILIFFPFLFFVKESPKYLVSIRKFD